MVGYVVLLQTSFLRKICFTMNYLELLLLHHINYFKHLFWSQKYKTKNQPQKEKEEKNKYVEIKQHAMKNPMDIDEIKEIKKYPETKENENTTLQNL